MKLISMVAFVLLKDENGVKIHDIYQNQLYAEFLNKPLNLSMFVPCKLVDGVWVVLEEPKECNCAGYIEDCFGCEHSYPGIKYQEAKDRVLFEYFEYDERGFAYSTNQIECRLDEEYMQSKTLEDLIKYDLDLTITAQKQSGLCL